MKHLFAFVLLLLASLVVPLHCRIAVAEESVVTRRIDPSGIAGSLVIAGGGSLPDNVIDRFLELAGGREARLVLIPTASRRADSETDASLQEFWAEKDVAAITVLHSLSRDEADREEFVAPLKTATAVWFGGGQQSRIVEAYVGTAVELELHALLQRDGVIGGTSAGAAVQSRLMIARGNPVPTLGVGFDFLSGSVVDQHFLQRNRKPRLLHVLRDNPGYVGFGIDEKTALVVQARRLRVFGESTVTVCLAASATRPAKELTLAAGDLADLTALRRAAVARAQSPFPPVEPNSPKLRGGSLILGGGGRLPDEVIRRFIELAGGPQALIVVLPTAIPDPLPEQLRDVEMLKGHGAQNVIPLRERRLSEVESERFLETLRKARGVWFGGGRQWRFVDAYADTKALELLRDVLRRGGVVGGSSAGASIQAEYLVRGNPLGNRQMMAEGYERGFGFLPGCAVDQHFAARKRFRDMARLVETYPQILGIGIDENTAMVVQQNIGEVVGRNHVYFYDRSGQVAPGKPDYVTVGPGQRYDLAARALMD